MLIDGRLRIRKTREPAQGAAAPPTISGLAVMDCQEDDSCSPPQDSLEGEESA
jgi:hypothetical protein